MTETYSDDKYTYYKSESARCSNLLMTYNSDIQIADKKSLSDSGELKYEIIKANIPISMSSILEWWCISDSYNTDYDRSLLSEEDASEWGADKVIVIKDNYIIQFNYTNYDDEVKKKLVDDIIKAY